MTGSEYVNSADRMGVCPRVRLITKSKTSPPKPEEEPMRVHVRTQLDACTWTISHLTIEIKEEGRGYKHMTKGCSGHNIVIPSL